MRSIVGGSWGHESLVFDLPGIAVLFEGLSAEQKSALEKQYTKFLDKTSLPDDVQANVCHAVKLTQASDVSTDELIADGQYAPKKLRIADDSGIHITGINFEAQFAIGSSNIPSFLGVLKADELAQANVLENYLRIVCAHAVLKQGGVVLHSAGLVFDGRAYVFSGRSNAGKTTLTRKAYAAGATVLSDDINLVLPSGEDAYRAYAVPFTGEFGRTLNHLGTQDSYPLAGVVLLEQSDQLQINPVLSSVAVARLLTGCPFVNTDEHESDALFDSVTALVSQVPVIRLQNRRDDSIEDIMEKVHQGFDNIQ